MLLPAHDFIKPASLKEGLEALNGAEGDVKLLSGGTDVIFNMRCHLMTPDTVIAIKDLPELHGIEELPDGGLRIGGAERLTDLANHKGVQARFPALAAACQSVASLHVRNMGTLAGNICLDTRCWYTNQTDSWRAAKEPCLKTGGTICHVIKSSDICVAINNADTPPALIALDARVTLAKVDVEREVALADYFQEDGIDHTVREPGEILTSITVPPTQDRVVYMKETPRKGMDFAYGSIAARAYGKGESPSKVTVILGSFGIAPISLKRPVEIVEQKGLGDDAILEAVDSTRDELGALTNLYSPASYKRDLAKVLVKRALTQLREM
jgi:4-hydroxybenzoyl-CoA reductase beta subunit